MQKLILAVLSFALAAFGQATYTIDSAHTSAQFSIRHMMVSNVKGEFSKTTGSIVYDPNNLGASKVEATIDATSINTREPKRDAHLKSPDFFDVEKFPTLTFASTSWYKQGSQLMIKGNLTLHGVTKEVVLAVDGPSAELKDQRGGARIGASATTKINRKDFGLTWNRAIEAGGVVVGEEVTITIDLEATRKPPQA
jgi:polyisoprenoid-binding protein YceI